MSKEIEEYSTAYNEVLDLINTWKERGFNPGVALTGGMRAIFQATKKCSTSEGVFFRILGHVFYSIAEGDECTCDQGEDDEE